VTGLKKGALEKSPRCVALGFMPAAELGDFYRAADIAVWPATESISMLDATACGLPLVVSNQIYQDHVTRNGYAYRQIDVESLLIAYGRTDPAGRPTSPQCSRERRCSQDAGPVQLGEHRSAAAA
jgi:glycosyltransferase involved in cell wall biosynthesis